jgi:hypothetical protein
LSGFGYGDESLENGISQVKMEMTFNTDLARALNENKKKHTFDLMVFDNTEDYLCYVEAVHMLMHENAKKECDFLLNSKKYLSAQREKVYAYQDFLKDDVRVNEKFFVIDNTDYPEALYDGNWDWNVKKEIKPDPEHDVYVEIKMELTFTSNDKYFVWTFIFMIILIVLAALFVLALVAYCRQSFVYNRYAKERKMIKRELMKIKDTEYSNFLLQSSLHENPNAKRVPAINADGQDDSD